MGFSIGRGAVQCGLSVLLAMLLSPAALAEAAHQRIELAAALRQLDALERLVRHSQANTPVVAGERDHFDYPRLLTDLVQVRIGIQTWLTPSRAQPRDLSELSGDYRREQVLPNGVPPP
ncbi:RAQPRD family plasmid [Ventosimonas gracilis]|uniref:RAQPRD family plasmid n=1 Tax=Ventosimonas gracilis TaxID=1680762 RepID=A0A139SV48_9GAMM|nr:RAQPRD family plasmid [Ventosimonas gracilis]